MTLETYTLEQLRAEIDRRNAVDDEEARLFFADLIDAWCAPLTAQNIRDNNLDSVDLRAIALIECKFAELRAENNWIEWCGGDCPVDYDDRVEVKFRNGEKHTITDASAWLWSDTDSDYDIIAYRVL